MELYTSHWRNQDLADLDAVKVGISRVSLPVLIRKKAPYSHRMLRACFAEFRVGIVVYAVVHEKDLSHRPLRRGMGLPEDPPSGLEATG